ncbi:hypothetical protein KBD20_03805 [Candidatus Saccharibacteria bacterium]|nr:hypothetical protein [Candidatus Saccharibacteria bacterium]
MFYISFSRQKPVKGELRPAAGQRYVAVPEQYAAQSSYFQVYENGHPLMGMHFATRHEARKRLAMLENELRLASNGWYHVERKLPSYRAIGSILGFRKVYGDGSSVSVTYVIRKIRLQ